MDWTPLHEKPWNYSYLSLIRHLNARSPAQPSIGDADRPKQENFRLGQRPSLVFAPREISDISMTEKGHLKVSLFGLGLWGANGPLPLHFTEMAYHRENQRDKTLADFADIFHHRALTQFYQAWQRAQSVGAGLDRKEDERFSFFIASLSGQEPGGVGDILPPHARLAASAHLVREARNPDGLCATLSHYFGVPFQLQEFVLHWIALAEDNCTRLGQTNSAAVMGEGALVGQHIADRQHKFRLTIGPLDLQQYQSFLPNGRHLRQLIEWVRVFTGHEYNWEIALQLAPNAAPAAQIGGEHKLGWTTWLGQTQIGAVVTGMVFAPEYYLAYGKTSHD